MPPLGLPLDIGGIRLSFQPQRLQLFKLIRRDSSVDKLDDYYELPDIALHR